MCEKIFSILMLLIKIDQGHFDFESKKMEKICTWKYNEFDGILYRDSWRISAKWIWLLVNRSTQSIEQIYLKRNWKTE